MEKKIISICGESEEIFDFEVVGNDPNFIFENDPNFETVVLYDPDGNIVNVNSWIECANYASGIWTNGLYGQVDPERILLIITIISISLYMGIKKLLKIKKVSQ